VVQEPSFVQQLFVLGLLVGVFMHKAAQSTRDSLVNDFDGQVLTRCQINTLEDVCVVTLAQGLTLEELVLVREDFGLVEPVLLCLCNNGRM